MSTPVHSGPLLSTPVHSCHIQNRPPANARKPHAIMKTLCANAGPSAPHHWCSSVSIRGFKKSVQNPYKSGHFREREFPTPVTPITCNFTTLKCTDFPGSLNLNLATRPCTKRDFSGLGLHLPPPFSSKTSKLFRDQSHFPSPRCLTRPPSNASEFRVHAASGLGCRSPFHHALKTPPLSGTIEREAG
jgi:hypothetical protein